ncbi:mCG116118, isoform CRA_b, partial [Mus musculus]
VRFCKLRVADKVCYLSYITSYVNNAYITQSGVRKGADMVARSINPSTQEAEVVKPHAPLIKFPNRRDKPKLSGK